MMTVESQQQHERRISGTALSYGTLGSAVAWTLHIMLAYLIAEFGCETGMDAHAYAGIMLPAWMLLGMSAIMVLLSAGSTVTAYACLRKITSPDVRDTLRRDAVRYLARAGVMAGALFTFVIIVQTIPAFFYLSRC